MLGASSEALSSGKLRLPITSVATKQPAKIPVTIESPASSPALGFYGPSQLMGMNTTATEPKRPLVMPMRMQFTMRNQSAWKSQAGEAR